MKITIGWTKGTDQFYAGYRPGDPQHELSFEVEIPVADGQHPSPEYVAECAFAASNRLGAFGDGSVPDNGSITGQIAKHIEASGYRGQEAHFSLSVGDTVTVDGTQITFAPFAGSLRVDSDEYRAYLLEAPAPPRERRVSFQVRGDGKAKRLD